MSEETQKILKEFEKFLLEVKKVKGVKNFKSDIKLIFTDIKEVENVELTFDNIKDYLTSDYVINYLNSITTKDGKPVSVSTVRHKVYSYKIFFDFLIWKGVVKENNFNREATKNIYDTTLRLVERPVSEKKYSDTLTPIEFKDIINVLKTPSDDKNFAMLSRRNELLFSFQYFCGIKASELNEIKNSDIIDYKKYGKFVRITGKNYTKEIPIPTKLYKLVEDYMVLCGRYKKNRLIKHDYFFLSVGGKPYKHNLHDKFSSLKNGELLFEKNGKEISDISFRLTFKKVCERLNLANSDAFTWIYSCLQNATNGVEHEEVLRKERNLMNILEINM